MTIDLKGLVAWAEGEPTECLAPPSNRPDHAVLIYLDGLTVTLHRWLFAEVRLTDGATLPPKLFLRRKCGTAGCVNPWHLYASKLSRDPTPKKPRPEPIRLKGAAAERKARTKCPKGHDLTKPENVYTSKDKNGYVHRTCRRCKMTRNRKGTP